MILPSSVHIAKAEDILPPSSVPIEEADAQESVTTIEPRVISRDAIVNKTDKMCATGKLRLIHMILRSAYE